MTAKTASTPKKTAVSSAVNLSQVLGTQFDLSGRKLVNDTGKKEFAPFSPVELPSGVHTAVFTDRILVKENKNDEIMYFAFFDVDTYGTVLSSQKLDFINTLVKGAKYKLFCGEPKNGYSVIKKVEKA